MTKAVYILGLAGAGKTWITYSLYEWFKNINQNVAILNLDPGVSSLPYQPAIDIREFVDVWSIMERYNVGPNGALILSMDLLLDYVEKINSKIGELNPSLILIDTPGQMEIFAYRASGKLLMDLLRFDDKMLLFVIDGVFSKDPRNFISNYLVGGSIKVRFPFPIVAVLNKIDLLSQSLLRRILKWVKNPLFLKEDLEKHYFDAESDFLLEMYRLLRKHGLFHDFIMVSALYLDNFSQLIQAITRILFHGEEYFEL